MKTREQIGRDSNLEALLKNLHDLKEGRKDRFEQRLDGDVDKDALYKKTLEAIVALMIEIKQVFPDKVTGCNLFDNVLHSDWQEKFKNNFYKIFIDRHRQCDEAETCNYKKFNTTRRGYIAGEESADICYAEGFALAFLAMLHEVEKRFQGTQKDLSADELIRLFYKLNSISVARPEEEQKTNIYLHCGHTARYSTVMERQKAWQESGNDKYALLIWKFDYNRKNYENFTVQNSFSEEFNHEECAKYFFQSFFNEIKLGKDFQDASCELSDALGSDVHLCLDGNGRTAILLAWFLAISSNQSFAICYNPYFSDPTLFHEAKEWTKSFMRDPEVSPASEESKKIYLEVLKDAHYEYGMKIIETEGKKKISLLNEGDPDDLCLSFFIKMLGHIYQADILGDDPKRINIFREFNFCRDRTGQLLFMGQDDRSLELFEENYPVRIFYLKRIIEEAGLEIAATKDDNKWFGKIATLFVEKLPSLLSRKYNHPPFSDVDRKFVELICHDSVEVLITDAIQLSEFQAKKKSLKEFLHKTENPDPSPSDPEALQPDVQRSPSLTLT